MFYKNKYIPTIMGLGSIPLIIHPIDNFTDYLMNNTLRPYIFWFFIYIYIYHFNELKKSLLKNILFNYLSYIIKLIGITFKRSLLSQT